VAAGAAGVGGLAVASRTGLLPGDSESGAGLPQLQLSADGDSDVASLEVALGDQLLPSVGRHRWRSAKLPTTTHSMVGFVWPRDEGEREAAVEAGYDLAHVLTHDDLVRGDDVFFSATGVTDGDVLAGVRYMGTRGASTESLVMRSRSGTVRRIQSRHDRSKLRRLTGYEAG